MARLMGVRKVHSCGHDCMAVRFEQRHAEHGSVASASFVSQVLSKIHKSFAILNATVRMARPSKPREHD